MQGLEATEEWPTSRPPVTGEPGLLLGTVRGSDHYPHSRGTISRVVPQGLGESAQAAWAPPGGLKDQTLGLAPCT